MSWKKVLLEGDAAVLSDTVPGTIGENDTPAAGSAVEASRQDHVHGSPATWAPSAHLLDSHTAPTGAVDFNKQQATSLALDVQASAPGTPVNGQVYYNDTDDHPYVYVQ